MRVLNLRLAALALVGGISLGGCAYDTYGGYGGGYGPYSGVSLGVGYGGGYGYGYDGGYYGSPFGWYDDFYYPGTGFYVYDSYRHPRRWNERERSYWTHHNDDWHGGSDWHHRNNVSNSNTRSAQPNWSGFDHRPPPRRPH